MGGKIASTVGRATSGVLTLGASEVARSTLGKNSVITKGLSTPGMIVTGGQSGGWGGKGGGGGYTPGQLPQDDPIMTLAQNGGAPLLTNIALGGDVNTALASYFGHTSGEDFDKWVQTLSPEEQNSIKGVQGQLQQIQGNTELRNQAVQSVVKDFPNVVSMTAPQVQQAKAQAGQEFDAASKQYMDYALNAVGAKYAAGGQLSSGATAAASARAAAGLGLDRYNATTEAGNKELGLLGEDWQNRYNEANALQSFQQKMLGQGSSQGFSAAQAALNRRQQTNEFNTNANNDAKKMDYQSNQAMLGAVGGLAGTALGYAIGGPAGGMLGRAAASGAITGGMQGASSYGFSGPATPGYAENNNPANYGINPSAGGYR